MAWVRKTKIIALFVSRRLGEYAYEMVTIPSFSCVTARDLLFKTVRPVDVVNQSFRFRIFMCPFPRCCTLFPSDNCNLKRLLLEQFPNSHTTRVSLWYEIFYFLHVLLWYKHASPVSNAISWYCYSFAILLPLLCEQKIRVIAIANPNPTIWINSILSKIKYRHSRPCRRYRRHGRKMFRSFYL